MEPAEESPKETSQAQSEGLDKWRDRALRLEAEMDNFRKRQRRLADDRVAADREHLLRAFLDISDDLERALSATDTDAESLREGVRITLQSLSNMLEQEGVEPLEAAGAPFDPHLHEAVGTLPHQEAGSHPNTVVEVVRPGYRLDERLLRAARVIVAS
jgi:molecular chaperone GrpE